MRDNLPREMQPQHVIILKNLPLTSNGKVDTTRLPAPNLNPTSSAKFVAPKSEMERRLSHIIAVSLKTQEIGLTDDFLDLGIDSIAAIEIAIAANEAGIPLPTTALFEHRSLGALARFADDLSPRNSREQYAPLIDLDDDELASIAKAVN